MKRRASLPFAVTVLLTISPVQLLAAVQSECNPTVPVRISPQAVGPLPVAAKVRQLLTICSGIRTMRETQEHAYPAAEFHLGSLTVLASQTIQADSLSLDDPADTWQVKGTDGILPMGVPINSNWAALRRAYGAAIMEMDFDEVAVMFCKFPRLFLYLDVGREAVIPLDGHELTRIPANSKIVRIIISSWPFGASRCAGLQEPGR